MSRGRYHPRDNQASAENENDQGLESQFERFNLGRGRSYGRNNGPNYGRNNDLWRGRGRSASRGSYGPGRAGRQRQQQYEPKLGPGEIPAPHVKLDDLQYPDAHKPIILFDLNGTLTSHTARRRSAGQNRMRPGTHHLKRLLRFFKLGIYSSATNFTVNTVIGMLEAAAGPGPKLFQHPELILYRGHTQMMPQANAKDHITAGGKEWDTMKPLARYFGKLHRLVLVDDDEFKALPEERDNMILVPCWQEADNDNCIETFVNTVLRILDGLGLQTNITEYSRSISETVFAQLGPIRQPAQPNPEEIPILV